VSEVLICDDKPQILRALTIVLRDAGFAVCATDTGEGAVTEAATRQPDAAILDLLLPGIDGIEVCRRIREWSAMPVIVLSALGDEAEKARALEAGADEYITKPFSPSKLVAGLEARFASPR
jgi:two-component system, OmpR family, KDP operon response regulator KdpE